MHKSKGKVSKFACLAAGLAIAMSLAPGVAAPLVRIVITDAQGTLTLPGPNGSDPVGCGVLSSGGGCSTAKSGFQVSSGPAFLQPCTAVLHTSDLNLSGGACQIDNNVTSQPAAGTGEVTVANSNCSSFTINYLAGAPPIASQNVWFQDGGGRTWRVTQLRIKTKNGAPQGLGYAWQIAGRIDGTANYESWLNIKDFSNGDIFQLMIKGGGMASAVACNATQPVTGFTFQFEADSNPLNL